MLVINALVSADHATAGSKEHALAIVPVQVAQPCKNQKNAVHYVFGM